MSFDFALESKLASEAPKLHKIFSSNVMCCQNILNKYKSVFPTYTDHTVLHSLEVIAFCNELIGTNIDKINPDEIFVLLMAAYLHDSGMGISESDYEKFSKQLPMVSAYREKNPAAPIDEVVRTFHHEFSGKFIEKYQMVFDFPSEAHLWATIQASRGHRKTDLYDANEYPEEIVLENGNIIHLPYLAALIRITDELDIAADRNIQFLYNFDTLGLERNASSQIAFRKHLAIKEVVCREDSILAMVDFSDETLNPHLLSDFEKLNATLCQCVDVTDKRTPFEITQKRFCAYDCHTKKLFFAGDSSNLQ